MKNIITSLGVIVFVGAAVAGATGAFFSDTESSVGNVFTAGSVDLVLETLAHEYQGNPTPTGDIPVFTPTGFTFTLNDLKPLDWGAITYGLKNEENPAKVCVLVENKTNMGVAANAALASKMSFKTGSTPLAFGLWADLATLGQDATGDYALDYCFGAYDGATCKLAGNDTFYNPAQNGILSVDFKFYAVQTRNNPNFTCAGMNPVPEIIQVDSAPLSYSSTGWGGWSCPVSHPNVVGFSTNATEALGESHLWIPGAMTSGAVTYPNTPHGYTYGIGETGVIIQNGGTPQTLTITLNCQAN